MERHHRFGLDATWERRFDDQRCPSTRPDLGLGYRVVTSSTQEASVVFQERRARRAAIDSGAKRR